MTSSAPLQLHPDRLLPPGPVVSAIARRLYLGLVVTRPTALVEL